MYPQESRLAYAGRGQPPDCCRSLLHGPGTGRNRSFEGQIYHNYEAQCSTRNLGVRAIGRANSGTTLQGAQIRANQLARGSGLGKEGVETRVAGLLTASDATYGEKNMQWHGSYGKM